MAFAYFHGMGKFILSLALLVCVLSGSAQASIFLSYEQSWPVQLARYVEKANQSEAAQVTPTPQCATHYDSFLNKGELDIRYALGYFDESYGNALGTPSERLSPALDGISFEVLKNFLLGPCQSENQKLCAFSVDEIDFGKVVLKKKIAFHGKTVGIRLTLTQASASLLYEDNLTKLAGQQKQLIDTSEENFFDGIKTADIVIYNGHSRNGGGPDFAPPVLRDSDLHPNYKGYYEVKRIGMKKMLSSLRNSSNHEQVLGLFSCYSKLHFQKSIMNANPKQKLIITEDAIPYDYTIFASFGYLEGILQGRCGKNLEEFAEQHPLIERGFVKYNF